MNINNELFDFIKRSPTAYHAVDSVCSELKKCGFTEIYEGDAPKLVDGKGYFVKRNGSSLIAFRYKGCADGFMIAASHSDSPAFRLKATPERVSAYTSLDVERYGGMILYSWLDRPLSLAGRLLVSEDGMIESRLVNIDADIAVIPSVANHLNRGVNEGYAFNPAKDMLPLVASADGADIISKLAAAADVDKENVVSHDVFLYNREDGRVVGANGEFILSPRLDDLECLFASLRAFLSAGDGDSCPVLAVFDNEEVGSATKQGAASGFLRDTLALIAGESLSKMLNNSFMVSADNAHAKHPNHPELSDAQNAPLLNGGIVIKWNANQRYATDGMSDAVFREICKRAGARVQTYYNRADMLGGSTLGSISDTVVSVPTVDIGLAQLAMHSSVETAGAEDLCEMIKALKVLFESSLEKRGERISIK